MTNSKTYRRRATVGLEFVFLRSGAVMSLHKLSAGDG